ncbi:MAG: orotidine-5'-phosphate decarboxylase [Candidatus Acidiferrales bacterium]
MTPRDKPASRLIVALDFDSLPRALDLAKKLAGLGVMFKIGSQLYTSEGPRAMSEMAALGAGIFLDLKYHDIPNTVAGAVLTAAGMPGVELINVHALGGRAMLEAAAQAIRAGQPVGAEGPRLLAVTILTSMDQKAMAEVGISGSPSRGAVRLATLAKKSGVDGVVASVKEARLIRKACGKSFLIVTPGVRPATGEKVKKDDQSRVATPAEAIQAGADYIVVGRPITGAADPRAATQAILEEFQKA